jgi:hypothetical protein
VRLNVTVDPLMLTFASWATHDDDDGFHAAIETWPGADVNAIVPASPFTVALPATAATVT